MRLAILPVLLILAGCATDSPPAPATAPITVVCPSLRVWTKDQQAALATALDPIPETSPIWSAIRDWTVLRTQAVACKSSNH